ncbi:MAG: AAA domain-containing protein [Phycisphaerales bacterium]|nr:AAA domain-containing protein [Phycisphaerales bacterium]
MSTNPILSAMLQRLFASMAKGPSINCRPHASRQRLDLTLIDRLKDLKGGQIVLDLLSPKRASTVAARVAMPAGLKLRFGEVRFPSADRLFSDDVIEPATGEDDLMGDRGPTEPAIAGTGPTHRPAPPEPPGSPESPEFPEFPKSSVPMDPSTQAWFQQRTLLTKLRNLSDESRIYMEDTGAHALHIGYPLLSLPPGAMGAGISRVLAPIAFIPISLTVRTGQKAGIDLACYGQGTDLVVPNTALMAWLERQTGKPLGVVVGEDEGEKPWEEIGALVGQVCAALGLDVDEKDWRIGGGGDGSGDEIEALSAELEAIPKADELGDEGRIIRSAILGLFPASNESLLRDTQAMMESDRLEGPVRSFVDSNVRLEVEASPAPSQEQTVAVQKSPRQFGEERLIAAADPCQSRTVAKARRARGLVIYGPPGTGKSQTITNIIGDHLARGERVLFVCEKRTALDVVSNRLEHVGLGGLCALVHDPQRDQRDLYMAIRAELDGLVETKTNSRAERQLEKSDSELQRLHAELTAIYQSLMTPRDSNGVSFHDLMGEWLSIVGDQGLSEGGAVVATEVERATPDELEAVGRDIEVTLRRGVTVAYPENTWASAVGVSLDLFLARSAPEMRRMMASCVEDARAADGTWHESIPPFNQRQSLAEQVRIRNELAAKLRVVIDKVEPALAARQSHLSAEQVGKLRQRLQEAMPHLEIMRQGALDAELLVIAREIAPGHAMMAQQLAALNAYIAIANRWHSFIHVRVKSRAAKVLREYGLPLTLESATRLRSFLNGLRARQLLTALHRELNPSATAASAAASMEADDALAASITAHAAVLDVLAACLGIAELEEVTRRALSDGTAASKLLDGLHRSSERAAGLENLETSLGDLHLLNSEWLAAATAQFRGGKKSGETVGRLSDQFDTLESVIRIRHDVARLPGSFRGSVEAQLRLGIEPEQGISMLKRGVLAGEIGRRLSTDENLRQIDGERIASMFDRYRELDDQKRQLVRDVILHRWRSKQKERLLVSTGTRLNGEGAKLRQRLFVRGRRAMRLRQVIAIGLAEQASEESAAPAMKASAAESVAPRATADAAPIVDFSQPPATSASAPSKREAGASLLDDPLFDLCPVWMASPATVAQIFPLRPLFDVVVFDEASQCKLEEALPVLMRAKRVVIAGDPKQLPPTRFFEASISESEHHELETDQDLFEVQQTEIEDLLAAALNLEIDESYLDVHYRSRNADLIEFSNQQFYGDRLQPIPGHPANRTRYAPITLYRVDGVYEDRCNPPEAKRVCEIVRDLLKRAEAPSIGIACFNLMQRDLIVEMLDDLALEDSGFASRLAAARERKGEGTFEGLFVKNLENVQGDERDHIIISTTYGPNADGKFYRRFGPLGMPGGGRRLNVLVTRARHEVHLVTSIPREAYSRVEPIAPGQSPNGGWLLFGYLRYAEGLVELYEENHRVLSAASASETANVVERPIEPPSGFALAVGRDLAELQKLSSDVHWGNPGFRIEIAIHHPRKVEDVTVGVLCDFAQYARAQDPVEWDMFRTSIHESQGWRLHRLWSPQYFRDAQQAVNGIAREVKSFLASEAKQSKQRS